MLEVEVGRLGRAGCGHALDVELEEVQSDLLTREPEKLLAGLCRGHSREVDGPRTPIRLTRSDDDRVRRRAGGWVHPYVPTHSHVRLALGSSSTDRRLCTHRVLQSQPACRKMLRRMPTLNSSPFVP